MQLDVFIGVVSSTLYSSKFVYHCVTLDGEPAFTVCNREA